MAFLVLMLQAPFRPLPGKFRDSPFEPTLSPHSRAMWGVAHPSPSLPYANKVSRRRASIHFQHRTTAARSGPVLSKPGPNALAGREIKIKFICLDRRANRSRAHCSGKLAVTLRKRAGHRHKASEQASAYPSTHLFGGNLPDGRTNG